MSETTPTQRAVTPKRRRWPLSILIGLITGMAGAALAAPISDWAMEAHHVSTMEGGRACAVVAIWMPLALIAGAVIGFVVGLLIKREGFAGYALKQGISLAAIAALVLAVGGLSYAAADHPPVIEGKGLALDIEVRVPAKGRSIDDLKAQQFDVALVVSASDRNYADMRWSEASQTAEFVVVPAWAPLLSRNAGREITAGVKDENRQIFDVMLPASPKAADRNWSDWTPPRQRFDRTKPAPEDQYTVRYRVRFYEEYTPSLTPAAPPSVDTESEEPSAEDSSEPAESPTDP